MNRSNIDDATFRKFLERNNSKGNATISKLAENEQYYDEFGLFAKVTDFDIIIVNGFLGDRNIQTVYMTDWITHHYSESPSNMNNCQIANDTRAINFYFKSDNEIAMFSTSNQFFISEVWGVKL